MIPLSMRERLADKLYLIKTAGCLVPFKDQGEKLRRAVYEDVDELLDILTANPGPTVLFEGYAEIAVETDVACAAACFETMIRAIRDGK